MWYDSISEDFVRIKSLINSDKSEIFPTTVFLTMNWMYSAI